MENTLLKNTEYNLCFGDLKKFNIFQNYTKYINDDIITLLVIIAIIDKLLIFIYFVSKLSLSAWVGDFSLLKVSHSANVY